MASFQVLCSFKAGRSWQHTAPVTPVNESTFSPAKLQKSNCLFGFWLYMDLPTSCSCGNLIIQFCCVCFIFRCIKDRYSFVEQNKWFKGPLESALPTVLFVEDTIIFQLDVLSMQPMVGWWIKLVFYYASQQILQQYHLVHKRVSYNGLQQVQPPTN